MKVDFNHEFICTGIWDWEKPCIEDEIRYVQYAEGAGLDSVRQGKSRLIRDAMTVMSIYTQVTDEIDLASGVTNCHMRNMTVMAQTFSTLHELSGGWMKLGIGVWWDLLASRASIEWEHPLRRMWECYIVTKHLLDLENVTYEGQTFFVDDIELDFARSGVQPRDVSIYVGAMGETTHKLAGELAGEGIADGTFMNYLIPPEHNLEGLEKLKESVEKRDGTLGDADCPQLITVTMDENVNVTIDQAHGLVTQYIDQQPHIRKASGIDPKPAEKVQAEMGGWPVSAEDIEYTPQYVDDDMMTSTVTAGTRDGVIDRARDYCATGCTEPVVYPLTNNMEAVTDALAGAKAEV